MCEVLIIGSYTKTFQHKLSSKDKRDSVNEFVKMTKSFNGKYVMRRGIKFSKYHGVVVIKFDNENNASSFCSACEQSEYLKESQIFKLSSIDELEDIFINVNKRVKLVNE